MARLMRIYQDNTCYFVTTNIKEREGIFSNPDHVDVLLSCLKFYREAKKMKLFGYCIMPDHFHALILPLGKNNISSVMRDIKCYTSHDLGEKYGLEGTLWQRSFYDRMIRDDDEFRVKLNYIHMNPVKAGLVDDAEDYRYSSYRNYYLDDDSILEIDHFEDW